MVLSKNDLYPFTGLSVDTAGLTVPDNEENQQYHENIVNADEKGSKVVVNKNMIWGSLILLIGMVVFLKFLE